MFSIHTDDDCFYVGIDRGNDNSKKSDKSHIAPYQCCPTNKERAQARLSVLSDTKLGSSKATSNDITFRFEQEDDKKSIGKPKGSKKAPPKQAPSEDDRKAKKEKREAKSAAAATAVEKPEKKKRDRDVKEKEPKDSKDKDNDKKDKKGKDKKEKGKNTHDDDGDDGIFQLGNWW